MNIKELLKKHPSFVYADELSNIVKPLRSLGVTYFSHACFNQDGTLTGNSSNPQFLRQYFEEGFHQYDIHVSDKLIDHRYVLWDALNLQGKSGELYQSGVSLDVFHTLTIVEKNPVQKEFFHFAAPYSNDSISAFYLQNIDLLEQFVLYYKEQLILNKHLNTALKVPFATLKKDTDFLIDADNNLLMDSHSKNDFLKSIGKCSTKDDTSTKKRQAECAYWLTKGKTNKEIGALLGISPRTVEDYFERLKKRLHCKNKLELSAVIAKNGKFLL